MPNPSDPNVTMDPGAPADPLDYASNPPTSQLANDWPMLLVIAGFFGLLYWSHGSKSRDKTSWEE